MTDELLYANQWNISAKYFYSKGYYFWMADKLVSYSTILEIGCGTGYSTLALLKKGFKVFAVEKNIECIEHAKKLIYEKGYTDEQVIFIEGDITLDKTRNELINKYQFDAVICWNIGSYWNEQMLQHYLTDMLEYGLSISQINTNPESSYSEFIIWNTCRLAATKGVSAHIIERGQEIIDEHNDSYYYTLKEEFKFSAIEYDNKCADTISAGGRMLTTNGMGISEKKVDIILVSVLYK